MSKSRLSQMLRASLENRDADTGVADDAAADQQREDVQPQGDAAPVADAPVDAAADAAPPAAEDSAVETTDVTPAQDEPAADPAPAADPVATGDIVPATDAPAADVATDAPAEDAATADVAVAADDAATTADAAAVTADIAADAVPAAEPAAEPAADPAPAAEPVVEEPVVTETAPAQDDVPAAPEAGDDAVPPAEEARPEDQPAAGEAAEVVEDAPVAATEDNAEAADDAEREAVDVPAAVSDPETIEGDMLAAKDDEMTMDDGADAIEESEDVAAGLEAIAASLQASLEDGGLHPQAAEFMSHAVSAYTSRLGIEQHITPSLESFGGHSARHDATKISLEAVEETLKRIWDAIKAIAKKVKEAILAFIDKVLSASGRLKAAAEKTEGAAKAAEGQPKEGKIALGALAPKLAVGDHVDKNGLTALIAVCEDAMAHDEQAQQDLTRDYDALKMLAEKRIEGDQTVLLGVIAKALASRKPAPTKAFKNRIADSSRTGWSTDVLPGNVRFALEFSENAAWIQNDDLRSALGSSWRVAKTPETHVNVPEDLKIDTLTIAEINAICASCVKVAELAERAKKQADYDKLAFEGFEFAEDATDEQKKVIGNLIKQFSKRVALVNQATAKVLGYSVQTAGAYLTLSQRALAQYDGAPQAAAEPVAA